MKIHWSPIRMDETYVLEREGDTLIVDGEVFDFSTMPDGSTLPAEAIGNKFFCGPAEKIAGELHFTMLLPHGPNASEAARFPAVLDVTEDGIVEMPQ